MSLAAGTERGVTTRKLEDGDKEYERLLEIYVAEGGDEDEFEDPVIGTQSMKMKRIVGPEIPDPPRGRVRLQTRGS